MHMEIKTQFKRVQRCTSDACDRAHASANTSGDNQVQVYGAVIDASPLLRPVLVVIVSPSPQPAYYRRWRATLMRQSAGAAY
jgi:hypothetical protein